MEPAFCIAITCDHGDRKHPRLNLATRVGGKWGFGHVDPNQPEGRAKIACDRGCKYVLIALEEKLAPILDVLADNQIRQVTVQAIAKRVGAVTV